MFTEIALERYRALVKEKNPPVGWRTWDDAKERCGHCCNGDRCDDKTHYARDRCPYCLGTGAALWHPAIRKPEGGT